MDPSRKPEEVTNRPAMGGVGSPVIGKKPENQQPEEKPEARNQPGWRQQPLQDYVPKAFAHMSIGAQNSFDRTFYDPRDVDLIPVSPNLDEYSLGSSAVEWEAAAGYRSYELYAAVLESQVQYLRQLTGIQLPTTSFDWGILNSSGRRVWNRCSYPSSSCGEHTCFQCNDPVARATDPQASQELQKEIKTMNGAQIGRLFNSFKNKIEKMMIRTPTNLVIQALIERLSENQINEVLNKLCSNNEILFQICTNTYGARAMQKLLGRIMRPHQKAKMTQALRPIMVQLAMNCDGYKLILCGMRIFSYEENKVILQELAENCLCIGKNKCGYGLLMHIISKVEYRPHECFLLEKITQSVGPLSSNQHGNFVVQTLLQQKIPYLNNKIIFNLHGKFIDLSTDKYGSNVVEECIKAAPTIKHLERIILELLPVSSSLFLHEYGNYVMQTALNVSKERSLAIHLSLLEHLKPVASRLRSINFGKQLLSFLPKDQL